MQCAPRSGLLPFNIAEVYRATRLSLSDNSSAIWSIPGVYVSAHAERGIDITFPQLGEISVHLTRASAGGGAAMRQTTDLSVSVRLVRRELRSLTTVDRERYFAALRHVYMTAQSDGELRWGRSFKSAAWLVREHLAGAAQTATATTGTTTRAS